MLLTNHNINSFDELSLAEERLSPIAFTRKFTRYRIGDLSPRFRPFPEDFQLPVNSVIHLLDNMYARDNHLPLTDIPHLDIPFVTHDPFRKYLYHVLEPDVLNEENIIKLPKDYVFRNPGLNMNLMKFRKTLGSSYRFITKPEQIPTSQNTLTLINYNPLFRTYLRGTLPVYRQFKVILGSILNTVNKISDDKRQFIIVPLSHQIYQRDKFRLAETKETMSSIRSPNSFHYFFMMHWLNFINPFSDLSLFEYVPEHKWENIYIFFTIENQFKYGMLWSLKDATTVNEKNKLYVRYINQINSLVLANLGHDVHSDDSDLEVEKQIEQTTTDQHITTETKDTEVVTQEISESEPDKENIQLEELPNQEQDDDDELHNVILDKLTKELIPTPTPTKPTIAPVVNTTNPVTTVVNTQAYAIDKNKSNNVDVVEVSQPDTNGKTAPGITEGNETIITPFDNKDQVAHAGKTYIDDIHSHALELINHHPTLTAKQKIRAVNLATTSKHVKLNGKTIEQILTAPIEPTVNKNTLGHLEKHLPDASMIHSSIQTFDQQYMESGFEKDIASVALSLNKQGLFLTSVDEQVHTDELNRLRIFKFTYEDVSGKSHNVKFKVPHVNEDGTCLVNGIKCIFRKQMTNLPICKVSSTRVSLASNYNKTIVERNETKAHNFLAYIQRLLSKINSEKTRITVEYGIAKITDRVSYEYSSLAALYSKWILKDTHTTATFIFDYNNRYSELLPSDVKIIKDLELKYGIYLGFTSNKGNHQYLFISINNIITVYNATTKVVDFNTTLIDTLSSIYNVRLNSALSEWVDIKILDKKFPIIFILGYQFGLSYILKYLKCDYTFEFRRSRSKNIRATDIVIHFSDGFLVIPRYPLRNSLIVAGLLMFNTRDHAFEDFDFKDVYYTLLTDKGYRTNYLKGIEDTFKLFIDPMTRDVLLQMNEPITFEDLLIRATDMLTVDAHKEAASMYNHRLRSFERIPAIVYNEVAREFAAYQKKAGKGSTFSINPEAVIQRILQDQAMLIAEDINPIHEIKTQTGFTYSGAGGRTSQSFVVDDRRYPEDAVGIISESTPDSGSVAITAIAPPNPTIANTRGLLNYKDKADLDPSNILSTTSLLMPGVTQDDGKRANFVSIQLSHQLPTKEASCCRIRTGEEMVIAHRSSSMYAYAAKQDGKVVEIDSKLEMCKVQYKDGTVHALHYGDKYGECSDLVTTQRSQLNLKLGDKFNEGDILIHNPQFFEYDPLIKQVNWLHGVEANIAIIDCPDTFEDSNVITKELGDKLSIEPVQVRSISIDANSFIHSIKQVGDEVDVNDYLLVFEDSNMQDLSSLSKDDEAINYLAKLNRTTPKAKATGKIVKIEAYYSVDPSNMHATVAKAVKTIIQDVNNRSKFSRGTKNYTDYPPSQVLPEDTKYKKVQFDKNTVVFRFFIQEELSSGVGDKIVFDSSLKSISGTILDEPFYTESGVKVDGKFSGSSISNRIVMSPLLVGCGSRIIEEIERQAVELYFGEERISKVLYHGSPRKHEVLIPKNDSKDRSLSSLVFATESKSIALAYAGKMWNDALLSQGTHNGKPYLMELTKNIFKDIYEQEGYLHYIDGDTFVNVLSEDRPKFEVATNKPVVPYKIERIPNVLQALQKDTVDLYFYDRNSQKYKDTVVRLAQRARDKGNDYLDWIKSYNLDLYDDIVGILNK